METQKLFETEAPRLAISNSMLALYSQCPRRYKNAYIDRLQHLKRSESMKQGAALHNILYEFYKTKQNDLADLLRITEKHLAGTDLAKAKDMLTNFYTLNEIKEEPKLLEYSFRSNFKDFTLYGRFDRVDEIDGGCEIIDYKLGSGNLTGYSFEDSTQWIFYWMAFDQAFMGHKKAISFSYYILGTGEKITIKPSSNELEMDRNRVMELIYGLKNDTEFLPKKNRHCSDCLFYNSCEINR